MNIKSITSNKPLLAVLVGAAIIVVLLVIYFLSQRQPNYNDLINAGLNGNLNQSIDGNNNNGFTQTDYAQCVAGCEAYFGTQDEVLSCKNTCEAAVKFESKDISACNDLEGILKDTCIIDKAEDQKKPEYCQLITSQTYRDTCFVTVAEETKDPSVCNNIPDSSIFKASCLSNFE